MSTLGRGVDIEIVEVLPKGTDVNDDLLGIIKPDRVRINGVPILCCSDYPITINYEANPGNRGGALTVTFTVFARSLSMYAEEEDGLIHEGP